MDETWTLPELVAEASKRIEALPPPKNGQVRAVPDERTVRYYSTLGLLDRPAAMRGRTALYGRRHLAQVVAIKRLQGAGRSLAEIQELWPTLDNHTLSRMSGVDVGRTRAARREFWKREPVKTQPPAPVELKVELAPNLQIVLAVSSVSLSPADVQALRDAAAPLVSELARRGLAGTLEEREP